MSTTRALITGASGLVGGNLAVQLRERGVKVRATRRPSTNVAHLTELGLDIEWVPGELDDADGLARACDGVDVVFHCAAMPTQTRRIAGPHRAANVEGTRNVVNAVKRAGVARLVHCSSVVTCAIAKPGGPDVVESDPWNFAERGLAESYSITKREAELIVLASDVDAVVVNPGTMFGPLDAKPSSGRMLVALDAGQIIAAPSGTSNWVDVRDVCRGMIAAWQKGKRGERYILGGINLHYREAFAVMCEALGRRPVRFTFPDALVKLGGFGGDVAERLFGREMDLNSAVTSYSVCSDYRFSSQKAVRELGYALSPFDQAVRDGVAWMRAHGKLKSPGTRTR